MTTSKCSQSETFHTELHCYLCCLEWVGESSFLTQILLFRLTAHRVLVSYGRPVLVKIYGGPFWSKLLYLIFGRCGVILVVPSNYLCSDFQFLTTFSSFLPCLIIIFCMSELFLCIIYFLHVLIIFVYKLFFVHVRICIFMYNLFLACLDYFYVQFIFCMSELLSISHES